MVRKKSASFCDLVHNEIIAKDCFHRKCEVDVYFRCAFDSKDFDFNQKYAVYGEITEIRRNGFVLSGSGWEIFITYFSLIRDIREITINDYI